MALRQEEGSWGRKTKKGKWKVKEVYWVQREVFDLNYLDVSSQLMFPAGDVKDTKVCTVEETFLFPRGFLSNNNNILVFGYPPIQFHNFIHII